jgi:FMN phosphatase YigB (HAD superfamily)
MAVVSNSEGTVEALLHDLGLRRYFRTVLDSWVVGIAKPDPRIFAQALAELDVPPAEAVMVGDSPSADIAGAASAGVPGALLDPFDLYPDETAPRFSGFADFANAMLSTRNFVDSSRG